MAKKGRRNGPLDCRGRNIEEAEKERIRDEIEAAARIQAVSDIVASYPRGPGTLNFVIIDVQSWCRVAEGGRWVCMPAEVGVVEMSATQGIVREWHKLIHFGTVPLGYRHEMMTKRDREHRIPMDLDKLESDYVAIVDELLTFIAACVGPDFATGLRQHSVFVMPNRKDEVQESWRWLCNMTKTDEDRLEFFELPLLLSVMAKEVGRSRAAVTPSVRVAEGLLEKEHFSYSRNVACSVFHENEGCASSACALGRARSLAYHFCVYVCPLMEVRLLEKVHYPAEFDVSNVTGA